MRVLSLIVAAAALASARRYRPIRDVDPEAVEQMKLACATELASCGFAEDMPDEDLPAVFRCMKEVPRSETCTAALPTRIGDDSRADKLEAIRDACTTELASCGYDETTETSELWEVMKCVKSSELSDVCEAALPAKPGRQGGRGGGNRAEKLEVIMEFCDDELAACGYLDGMAKEEMMPVMTCMKSSELSDVCAAALPARGAARGEKLELIKEPCADELAACGYVEGLAKEELFPVWSCMKTSELSEQCASAMPVNQGRGTGSQGKFGRGRGRGSNQSKFGGANTFSGGRSDRGSQNTRAGGQRRRGRRN